MSKEIQYTLGDEKLYTQEQVIDIIWEAVDQIEASFNKHEVTEEFIKNKFVKLNQKEK